MCTGKHTSIYCEKQELSKIIPFLSFQMSIQLKQQHTLHSKQSFVILGRIEDENNPLNLITCHKCKVGLVSKPLKRPRNTNSKKIVFNFVELNEFVCSDKFITVSVVLEFDVNTSEEEFRGAMCCVIRAS